MENGKKQNGLHSSMTARPFTVVVEGNIGSGKTTFLENFRDRDNTIDIIAEPVDKWRNCKGHNLLEKMYSDPKRYSLLFQTYVQLTMLQQHTANMRSPKPFKIMERSLLSARYCFVENLYAEGKMEACEYEVISEWFNFIMTCPQMDFKIDLIVYLRTDPEVAYRRIMERERTEECKIPFQYIKDLHKLHEEWLYEKSKFQPLPAKVLVIDANDDLSELKSKYEDCKDSILKMPRSSSSST